MPLTPDSAQSYFIRLRGKVFGPFTVERLHGLHSRGQFSRLHEISIDRVNWESAGPFLDAIQRPVALEPIESEPTALSVTSSRPPKAVQSASWYYSIGSEEHGPVSLLELRSLRMTGHLQAADFVWREGMTDWQSVSATPELKLEGPQGSAAAGPVGDGIHRTRASGSQMIGPSSPAKDPLLMAVLSGCCIAGLGQIILGQTTKGIVFLLANIVLAVVTAGIAALFTWPLMGIDAYLVAKKLKNGQRVSEWESFPT